MGEYEITGGEGRTRVILSAQSLGKDFTVFIYNENAHIGAVALGEPYPSRVDQNYISPSVSVLTRTAHKEDIIARQMASGLASAMNVPVLVCCGIHLDGITPDEIEEINKNSEVLLEKIIAVQERLS